MKKDMGYREITKEFETVKINIHYMGGLGSVRFLLFNRKSKVFPEFEGSLTQFDCLKYQVMEELNALDNKPDAIVDVEIDGKPADLVTARAMIERASGEI